MRNILTFALTAATFCAALTAAAQTSNGKLTLKLSGIDPNEGYGVQKGIKAPQIKVDITADDQTIEIGMLYPNKK